MKEAAAELNMTVVTIVAIAAIGAFFYLFLWPNIQKGLATNTCKNSYTCEGTITAVQETNAAGKKTYVCYCDGTKLSD